MVLFCLSPQALALNAPPNSQRRLRARTPPHARSSVRPFLLKQEEPCSNSQHARDPHQEREHKAYAFTQPSFSQLFVICAHRPHTTLPPAVTSPNSLTLTSIIVPFVKTPSCVYNGFCGFFFTEMIGNWTVTPSSGCVTFAFLYRNPIGRMKRSYLTGRRVKSLPTNRLPNPY